MLITTCNIIKYIFIHVTQKCFHRIKILKKYIFMCLGTYNESEERLNNFMMTLSTNDVGKKRKKTKAPNSFFHRK